MHWQPELIGKTLGVVLCGLVFLQALVWGIRARFRFARQKKTHQHCRQQFHDQANATLQRVQAERLHLAWIGNRPLHVAAIVEDAKHVKSFYLTAIDGQPLPAFLPGQYLTFELSVPGCDKPVVRCYSLSDQPHHDYYRCTIKRVPAPAGRIDLPPGRGSNFFHDHVQTGQLLQVQAPRGGFFLDPTDKQPIVLIAGGIGITPILSMLLTLAQREPTREGFLLAQMRNSNEHPLRELLNAAVEKMPDFTALTSYSNPLESDQFGIDYLHSGRLSIERIREILPSNNYRFYLCGPGPMMESLVPALQEWGVPDSHIHYEAFGPASIKIKGTAYSQAAPCEVSFPKSNQTNTWDGTHGSLLEFCESHSIAIETGCRAGSCGQCLTRIESGEIALTKQPGVPVEEGHCLLCVSVPAGPLTLDA